MQNIQTIGITLRPEKPALGELFFKIKELFERHHIKVFCDKKSAKMIDHHDDILELDEMCQSSDMLVCVGGDGTLLNLIRNAFTYQKPILGISGGTLGFLLNLGDSDLEAFVEKIFVNDYRINERMMLSLAYNVQNNLQYFQAFNDIVLKNISSENMVKINLYINDELINSYFADGLIIATPSGSTGYNLSAGGPIVHPTNEAIIVTPICPQGFTQAPLVLPDAFKLGIQVPDKNGTFIIDGQKYDFIGEYNTYFEITKSTHKVHLIDMKQEHYLKKLKEKLSWGI